MRDILTIACGAGLQDGLNSCIFMACAVLIALGFRLKRYPAGLVWFRLIFCLFYLLGCLFFNYGPGQIIVLNRNFIFFVKVSYFILGLWAFVTGTLLLKAWFLKRYEEEPKPQFLGKSKWFFVLWATAVLGVLLSALSTIWPVDRFIFLLSSEAVLKNQWPTLTGLLGTYLVFSMWPLWLVWVFISIKELRPSLLRIVCAAIFLTASSCMIFIFK